MLEKTFTFLGIHFYPKRLKTRQSGWILLDLIMLLLVSVNIFLFIFYWIYDYHRIQDFFATSFPDLHVVLMPVYEDFPLIDLIFVSIFLTEFTLRWIVSIVKKEYHRWFFFPFVNWYDLLGSLPFGSFRFLRILRVIALVNRLQRMDILDLRGTYLYSRFRKYRAIIVEEISDRVVLNVLSGVQKEVKEGLPLLDQIVNEVIKPYKPELVNWVSQRLQSVSQSSYERYRDEIQVYVDEKISTAVSQNQEIKQIGGIPVVGPQIAGMLERAIQDIVFSVVNGIIQDLAGRKHGRLLNELSDVILTTLIREEAKVDTEDLNEIVGRLTVDILEIVKEKISVQEWKLQEQVNKEQHTALGHALYDPETEEERSGILPGEGV